MNTSMAPRQELDRHFLADILMTSALRRTAPSVTNSSQNAQSQKTKDYKCNLCNKSFPSFQALGGHRSIHGNKRIRDEPANNTEKSQKRPRCLELFPAPATTSSDTENASSLSEEEAYECDICHKTFSTYQALGGHKSCHVYNNNIVTNPRSLQLFPKSPSRTTSAICEISKSVSSCPEDIDLELRL